MEFLGHTNSELLLPGAAYSVPADAMSRLCDIAVEGDFTIATAVKEVVAAVLVTGESVSNAVVGNYIPEDMEGQSAHNTISLVPTTPSSKPPKEALASPVSDVSTGREIGSSGTIARDGDDTSMTYGNHDDLLTTEGFEDFENVNADNIDIEN